MNFFNTEAFQRAAGIGALAALSLSLVGCGPSQQNQINCNSVPLNSTSEFRDEPYKTLRYNNLSVDDEGNNSEKVQGGGAITRAAEKLKANTTHPNLVLNLSKNKDQDMKDLSDSKDLFGVQSPASIIGENILSSKGVPEDARVVIITNEEKVFCMGAGGNTGR